ncbi:MAG TPA: HNH endonuclease [Rhizomicrobium sp.]|nr:HNH endonuclease [Rhizomicrobium sp.]
MAFRKPLKITSRTSSITNSFVQAIIPHVPPTADEIKQALAVLGMSPEQQACVYCGTPATDWDHLRPLVRGKRPTGYIDEIRNLVPACGPCNQSKSGAEWRTWMEGAAPGSPKTRGIADLPERIARLHEFERWGNVKPLPLEDLAGTEQWDAHWANLQKIEEQMKTAQVHAVAVRDTIQAAIDSARSPVPLFDSKRCC